MNENITYEFFGINPAEFYAGKFALNLPGDLLASPINKFHIDCERARFLVDNVVGNRVLDIGCGSAPFGRTLRAHADVRKIYGIDLDPICIDLAKKSYDFCTVFDLNSRLPFDNEYFDCVFSMDVLGHIEFRYKDHLLSEIFRVTKKGGRSVHGIECGIIDYQQAKPWDKECAITNYVLRDGHVGVESSSEIKSRWERFFSPVIVHNAFVWPFLPFMAIKHMSMPKELMELFDSYKQDQIDAVQVVLGFLHNQLRAHINNIDPTMLFPNEESAFSKHCGFVYLIAVKE